MRCVPNRTASCYGMENAVRQRALPLIATYEDHRMAMAFAPACITLPQLMIDEPQVVSKSYPGYWEDLKKAGFTVCH